MGAASGAGSAGSTATPDGGSTVYPLEIGPPRLQASWAEGRIVVWAGGPGVDATAEDLQELLEVADADGIALGAPSGRSDPGATPR